MFFWFKQSKITVDCFIDSQVMGEAYAIRRGIKFTPEWWQELPQLCPVNTSNIVENAPTAKRCPGFLSLYKQSWMIPMWSDLIIETKEDGSYNYKLPVNHSWSRVSSHPPFQYRGGFKDKIHFKLLCPWTVIDKKGTPFAYIPATWSLADTHPLLSFLPGVVEFAYNHSVHANIIAPKISMRYEFNAGTPLIHLLPLTDKQVEFKTHVVTETEFKQLDKDTNPRYYNKFYK
jgi:hypothetical protein